MQRRHEVHREINPFEHLCESFVLLCETEKQIKYHNDEITVVWKPEVCKHSGRCVTQLGSVFNTQARPWINMQGASAEAIINQVEKCPTGALSFYRNENIAEPKS